MLHEQFEHQHAANTIENEKLEFQIVAISVDMAASSPKMLRIARKMDWRGERGARGGRKTERKRRKERDAPSYASCIHGQVTPKEGATSAYGCQYPFDASNAHLDALLSCAWSASGFRMLATSPFYISEKCPAIIVNPVEKEGVQPGEVKYPGRTLC